MVIRLVSSSLLDLLFFFLYFDEDSSESLSDVEQARISIVFLTIPVGVVEMLHEEVVQGRSQ